MYFPKPAVNENDLAIIERGDTAEHSISAGQYVSWKGKLGKAVSAILQGATLDDSLFSYETYGVLNNFTPIPDYSNVDMSASHGLLTSNSQTVTIQNSGYYAYKAMMYGNNGQCYFEINGKKIFSDSSSSNSWACVNGIIYLSAGDQVKVYGAGDMPYFLYYIPLK